MIKIVQGDCLEVMRGMDAGSVQCCITSPPYWGLRCYGVDGQYGLEKSPEEFIAKMVEVFGEIKRVLRDDGTLWLNMGDSYVGGGGFSPTAPSNKTSRAGQLGEKVYGVGMGIKPQGNLKSKDLCGMPWRLAFALQADGWYLRSACPWVKRSAMPESCTDRPSSALEYIFLLTKQPKYYYDADAVRVITGNEATWKDYEKGDGHNMPSGDLKSGVNVGFGAKKDSFAHPAGRNRRNSDFWFESVGMLMAGDEIVGFDVCPRSFKGSHFATFPPKLIEPMVKAGTSEKGCCPKCGAGWYRITKTDRKPTRPGADTKTEGKENIEMGNRDPLRHCTETQTVGWRPGCECCNDDCETYPPPVPCTILDPFGGAGTTGLVADRLGRDAILIELNQEYCDMAKNRIHEDNPLFSGVEM